MGQVTYGINDKTDAGLRAEYTKQGDTKAFEVAVGPGFSMDKDFKVKLDYTLTNTKVGDLDSITAHGIALAGVMKF
jgi:hypothetical protein